MSDKQNADGQECVDVAVPIEELSDDALENVAGGAIMRINDGDKGYARADINDI